MLISTTARSDIPYDEKPTTALITGSYERYWYDIRLRVRVDLT